MRNTVAITILFFGVTLGCAAPCGADVIEYFGKDVVTHKDLNYLQKQKLAAKELQANQDMFSHIITAPEEYKALIIASALQHEIDPVLLNELIFAESNYDPYALSPKGAKGLTQLMDATAKQYGVTNSYDTSQNIDGGAKYLRDLLAVYDGDVTLALAAYNAGETAVAKYDGVPPYEETQNYVKKITDRLPAESEPALKLEPKPATLVVFDIGGISDK